ncbi:MAG: penicillin-binding protein 2 [bacterium]|nr:penicillin-binding protein 2 [bacterium]
MRREHDVHFRSGVLRGVVSLLLAVLVVNLFIMTVARHAEYKGQALENRQARFHVRAPRGRILDRHGTPVADNMFVADVTVAARSLGEDGPDSTLVRLMTWFDLPRQETLDRLAQQKERGRRRLVLVPNASLAQVTAVEERVRQLPGVRVDTQARRRYLHGSLVAHITGYVGEVGRAELDTAAGYRIGDDIGKLGVEAAFEDVLRGRAGLKLEEVNASGRIVGRRAVWMREPRAGSDVRLTISLPLQVALRELLGDRSACAVALSVPGGEVLAACSLPAYDPNLLTGGISTDAWQQLANDPAKPFFNRIVQATYPPGSLYKPVTSLAALYHGLVGTETYLEPCTGGLLFGDRTFHCWRRTGHGEVNHLIAMAHSCDTYYYQLGLMLDIDQLAVAARAFGLGSGNAGIFTAEAAGNVPDRAWYDERFGRGRWTRGVLLNNAIGQGELLATPLQMVMLAARLAVSGRVPDPVFVADPAPVREAPPVLPFAEEHLAWVRGSLEAVVEWGTGKAAQVPDVVVAGKTGTSQNPHGEDHACFMCYAPADRPEVALAIILENAGHGGAEAAPLAGVWLAEYFARRGELGLGVVP